MKENDAPDEQYTRLGLPADHEMTLEELRQQKQFIAENDAVCPLEGWEWTAEAKEQFLALAMVSGKKMLPAQLRDYLTGHPAKVIDTTVMEAFTRSVTPESALGPVLHVLNVVARRS